MWQLRIEIFPADLDATVAFYTEVLGFEVVREERSAEVPYASFIRGQVRVGAVRRPDAETATWRRPPTGVELVLEVDDLDHMLAHVQRSGWPIEEGLADRPWGLRDFRILDPSGYYWRLTEAE